jgi:hypothetical protein
LTKDEFVQWRHSSVTEQVFEMLRIAREAYAEMLTSGATLESLNNTAKTVGTIQAFDYLLNLTYEDGE